MTAANENWVWDQLPQPTRPSNSYDMSLETPSTTYPQNLENSKFSNVPQQQPIDQSYVHDVPVPPTMAKEVEGERKLGVVDKLVDRVIDKYEKLPERFIGRIHMKESKTNVEPQCTDSRGLEQPVIEEKLERFKVRTVVAEKDVKEEDKK